MVVKLMVVSKAIRSCRECVHFRYVTDIKGTRIICKFTDKIITNINTIPEFCTLETIV
jgi:ppGpp synthetase/RelA/SpoT-type nucleotidyltranferase